MDINQIFNINYWVSLIKDFVWKIISFPFKLFKALPSEIKNGVAAFLIFLAVLIIVIAWIRRDEWRTRFT